MDMIGKCLKDNNLATETKLAHNLQHRLVKEN